MHALRGTAGPLTNLPMCACTQGASLTTLVFFTPLLFGVGHVHHVYFLVRQGCAAQQALQAVSAQVAKELSKAVAVQHPVQPHALSHQVPVHQGKHHDARQQHQSNVYDASPWCC